MTDQSSKPAQDKKSDNKLFIIVAVVLLALGVLMFATMKPPATVEATVDAAQNSEIEKAYSETETSASQAVSEVTSQTASSGELATTSTLKERVLGNPSAPLKITEYASLTCSHCAHFHKDTFDSFKAYYIDTGRAYFVFNDFPLNAPALHASLIARCLPEDKFFSFIGTLFREQETWATDASYLDHLKKKAEPLGLTEEQVDACLKDEDTQKALLERMKAVQEKWKITSTPSFVVNNQVVISGSLPYAEFDKKIKDAAAELKIDLPELPPEPKAAPTPVEPAAEEATPVAEEAAPANAPEAAPEEAE